MMSPFSRDFLITKLIAFTVFNTVNYYLQYLADTVLHTYVQLKSLVTAEDKKSPIKDVLKYLNDIRTIVYSIFSQV